MYLFHLLPIDSTAIVTSYKLQNGWGMKDAALEALCAKRVNATADALYTFALRLRKLNRVRTGLFYFLQAAKAEGGEKYKGSILQYCQALVNVKSNITGFGFFRRNKEATPQATAAVVGYLLQGSEGDCKTYITSHTSEVSSALAYLQNLSSVLKNDHWGQLNEISVANIHQYLPLLDPSAPPMGEDNTSSETSEPVTLLYPSQDRLNNTEKGMG